MDGPKTEGKWGGGADKQQVIVGEIYSQIKPELPLAPIIIITLGHGNERKF